MSDPIKNPSDLQHIGNWVVVWQVLQIIDSDDGHLPVETVIQNYKDAKKAAVFAAGSPYAVHMALYKPEWIQDCTFAD